MTDHRTTRRTALSWLAAGIALPVLAACGEEAQAATLKVKLTDAQWKARLSPAAYQVLRHEDTERAFSSPLNNEHRKGTFLCAGCNNELYDSSTKFESGTGWPSFYRPLPGAIGTKTDYKLGYPRTAVYCADCGGHLGHVFKDGPPPTGLRYCMNGVAMKFRSA
jgi:peptide-methionine (R)-S-oxide reductase